MYIGERGPTQLGPLEIPIPNGQLSGIDLDSYLGGLGSNIGKEIQYSY